MIDKVDKKSPKCTTCLAIGRVAQTLHIAGSPYFKCRDCKRIFHMSVFEDIEFLWHTSLKEWGKFQIDKGFNVPTGLPIDYMQSKWKTQKPIKKAHKANKGNKNG